MQLAIQKKKVNFITRFYYLFSCFGIPIKFVWTLSTMPTHQHNSCSFTYITIITIKFYSSTTFPYKIHTFKLHTSCLNIINYYMSSNKSPFEIIESSIYIFVLIDCGSTFVKFIPHECGTVYFFWIRILERDSRRTPFLIQICNHFISDFFNLNICPLNTVVEGTVLGVLPPSSDKEKIESM